MAPNPHPSPLPLTLTLALLLPLLFSSVTAAAPSPSPSPSPSPAPAPAPHLHRPPRPVASHAIPPPPNHHRGSQYPHPTPPRRPPEIRLNFGERLGIAFAGVAVGMQVVLAAFLAVRARQLRRLEKAEVSSSTPLA